MDTRNVNYIYNATAGGYPCDADTGLIPHPFEIRDAEGDLLLDPVPGFWIQNTDSGSEGWMLVKASAIDYFVREAGEPTNPAWILPPELDPVPPIFEMIAIHTTISLITDSFSIAYFDLGDGEVPCAYDETGGTVLPLDKLWLLNTGNTNQG